MRFLVAEPWGLLGLVLVGKVRVQDILGLVPFQQWVLVLMPAGWWAEPVPGIWL